MNAIGKRSAAGPTGGASLDLPAGGRAETSPAAALPARTRRPARGARAFPRRASCGGDAANVVEKPQPRRGRVLRASATRR